LILRKLGMSRWQLYGQLIPIAVPSIQRRRRLLAPSGQSAMSGFAPLSAKADIRARLLGTPILKR